MKTIAKNSKCVKLKALLVKRIVSGEFSFGERFIGLHQLCKDYDISYVTANKAMKLLVKDGYLQAKNGVGYFVCYVKPDIIPPRKIVNFITGLSDKSSLWDIVMHGKELFEEDGWHVNLIAGISNDISSCVSAINSPEAYSVLFFTRLNWENFIASFNHVAQRVIVIGTLSGNADITSIISDEYETVLRCIEYFRKNNRKKTGIITMAPAKEPDMLRVAAWHSIMHSYGADFKELDQNLLILNNLQTISYEELKKLFVNWLKENGKNIDSVIVPYASSIFFETCNECGYKIPEDIAVICVACSKTAESSEILPILDNNFFEHFKFALKILNERFKTGQKRHSSWIFCPPGKLYL